MPDIYDDVYDAGMALLDVIAGRYAQQQLIPARPLSCGFFV
jgi:hypothetical protein